METVLASGQERWRQFGSRYEKEFPRQTSADWRRALRMVVLGKLMGEDRPTLPISSVIESEALFITKKGRVGLAPWGVTPGQQLWIVGGSRWPLILAPTHGNPSARDTKWLDFTFISECFVYGIMDGEAPDENIRFRLH